MDIVLIVAAICGVVFACWCCDHGRYSDGRNPAQRVCDDCGQCQWMYANSVTSHHWWEPNGEILDPTCKCHKDVK